MTRNFLGNSTIVGPVMQFSLLMVPLVMSCFFVVYAMAGWVIDGRDRLNWAVEAPTVSVWVALSMFAFGGLVIAYVRWRGGSWWHPLIVSSVGHIVLAVLMTLSVFITVKL